MSAIPVHARAARALEQHRAALVTHTVDREFAIRPEYWARFGEKGRARCLEDTHFHLSFLVSALTLRVPAIFADYVRWLVPMLEARGVGRDDVVENFRMLAAVVRETLPEEEAGAVTELLESELAKLDAPPGP